MKQRVVLLSLCAAAFLLLLTCCLIALGRTLSSPPAREEEGFNYGLVMDAGSVHTTTSVYRWPVTKTNGTGVVEEIFSCEGSADSGISSYAAHPEAVADALAAGGCLDEASARVPEPLKRKSVLFLGGTAGMRVLNATNSSAAAEVVTEVRKALDERGFLKEAGRSTAKILGSTEEGILGWITVNQLSGAFNDTRKSVGALDWGGASSQITFQVDEASSDDGKNNTHEVSLFGKDYKVFTTSHLCYGQKEAGRRYFVELVYEDYKRRNGSLADVVPSPCQPAGHEYELPAADLFFSACTRRSDRAFQEAAEANPGRIFRFEGTSSVHLCDLEVAKAFHHRRCVESYLEPHCFARGDVPAPPPSDFLAFSTYWYLISALRIPAGRVSEEDFTKTVLKLCDSSYSYAHALLGTWGPEVEHTSCFKGLFMHHLLRDGYRFSGWNHIDFVKRVSDAEVGWTLGYMLERTNSLPEVLLVRYTDSVVHHASLTGVIVVLCFVGLALCVCGVGKQRNKDYNLCQTINA